MRSLSHRLKERPLHGLAKQLARALDISLPMALLLCQRGIDSPEKALEFLFPKLDKLPSPFAMQDMHKAVQLIIRACKEKWPLVIYGDYDVDGISGAALYYDFFSLLDLQITCHLPNRLVDGYGLNRESLCRLAAQVRLPALLLTVDCGTTAVSEVRLAHELGFLFVVTDHHEINENIPCCEALLNPKQRECTFPFKQLSGVGVAFFLIMALRRILVEEGYWNQSNAPNLKQYLDLVALGTIADVMPLTDINRILVRAGLEVLSERRRPGIWALCDLVGLVEGRINTDDVSYKIAPRLNAAGRLGQPYAAWRLLTSKTVDAGVVFARDLEKLNARRRQLEQEALAGALEMGRAQVAKGYKGLVLVGPGWHQGVIGIIAARVVDALKYPVIALTDNGGEDVLKGSGRSVCSVNLYDVIERCSENVIRFGGHAMAIGLSLKKQDVQAMHACFDSSVKELLGEMGPEGHRDHETVIRIAPDANFFNERLLSFFRHMEPFGQGNPEPVFLLSDQKILHPSLIKDQHIRFLIRHNGVNLRVIGFGMAKHLPHAQKRVDLLFKIKQQVFRGKEQVSLHALAIASAGELQGHDINFT